MKAYLDQVERLGYNMPLVLRVKLILTSLSNNYDQFIQNYNIYGMRKTIPELHAMLKLEEKGIPKKAPTVLAIRQVSKDNVFYFNAIPRDGIFEIDMHNHISNERSIYTCSNKKSKHNLDSTFLWHCRLCHINKKRIAKLQHDGILKSINDESFNICVSCISGTMERKPFTHASERADDLLGIIHSDVCGPFRTTSREGDHSEPPNYQAALSDSKSKRWLEAMNAEMQSLKDNQVWSLVDLPPNCKTVRSKWLFKKNSDMDGNIHTYKARLVAKGFTQTYRVDYEETFSLVADIKDIRILIAIAAYFDYEIWQIDVKTPSKMMDTSKRGTIPMQPNVELSKSQGPSTPTETGYVFMMNGGAIDWKSSKQSTTVMYSIEAEYIAAAEALMEAI
ncbi:retrotransposon protein, putative, ty1-copia subclass [Tanacetum coccineum]